MSTLIPFLVLDQACDQVLTWVKQQLASAGLRVVQTFDLQVARLAHPDCPCPHHGTEDCNCQMVVLLVYGKQEDPATLIIHGQDGRSWVSLAGPMGKRFNQHLEVVVRRALIPHLSNMPSSIEVAYEAQPTI
jgi:hypothetical protein